MHPTIRPILTPRAVPLTFVALLAVILALSALGVIVASAQCPSSEVLCELEPYSPTGPTFSLLCSSVILGVSTIDFDVPARRFELSSFDCYYGAELSLRDQFVVHGPTPGTPIALRLRVRFNGYTHGLGRVLVGASPAPFEAGDDTTSRFFACEPSCGNAVLFADSLDLVITRATGTPFEVVLHGFAGFSFGGRLTARYEFVGLPAGATVTSCKGYSQEAPVPAWSTSWGALKATYR